MITILVYLVDCKAGLVKPIPRLKCLKEEISLTKSPSIVDAKHLDGCAINNPCFRRTSRYVNSIYFNSSYDIVIFQKDPMISLNSSISSNTYTIQYFPDGCDNVESNTGIQILSFNQNDMNSSYSLYSIKTPVLKEIKKLAGIIEFNSHGYSFGYIQLTFDTRSTNGLVYYSCADVRLQLAPLDESIDSSQVVVNGTVEISDPQGNPFGNATITQGGVILIPELVGIDLKNQDNESIVATQPDINQQEDQQDRKNTRFMFFARRWTPRQRSRIIKNFKKGPDDLDILALTTKDRIDTSLTFNREKEENYLNTFLSSPPLGPIVIVGPEGSGKSHIVRKLLSSRPMSILLDIRQNAVMTGDELLMSFLKKLGYLLPSSDPISSLLMKPDKKQKVNVQEILQGLDVVYQALIHIKDNYDKIPVITISALEALPSDSENFTRFIDWCISVTDNKLANIVFLTTSQFVHFHLDTNLSFKTRRFVYNIEFPPEEEVTKFLNNLFGDKKKGDVELDPTKLTEEQKNEPLLTSDEIENMVKIFGGQMRDIDIFSGLILRGENYKYVEDLFISETTQKIGSLIDSLFQKANISDSDTVKTQFFEKYQRLWKMLEILSENQTIRVSDLIQEVFHEQPEELDEYFQLNLIYFWMGTSSSHRIPEIAMITQKSAISSSKIGNQQAASSPSPTTTTTTTIIEKPSTTSLDTSTAATDKVIVQSTTTTPPVNESTTPSSTTITTQPPNTTTTTTTTTQPKKSSLPTKLNNIHYEYENFVSFSSPRIQYSVKLLFEDQRFQLQRKNIEKYFKKTDLKDEKKELEEEKLTLQTEYDKITTRLENLVANSKQWAQYIGESEFKIRSNYLLEKERELLKNLDSINLKIFNIENQLDNL
eukprot:gene5415-6754_t